MLLVLYLSTSDVGAVTREDLDGLQLVEDVTSDRTQNEQQPIGELRWNGGNSIRSSSQSMPSAPNQLGVD